MGSASRGAWNYSVQNQSPPSLIDIKVPEIFTPSLSFSFRILLNITVVVEERGFIFTFNKISLSSFIFFFTTALATSASNIFFFLLHCHTLDTQLILQSGFVNGSVNERFDHL